MIQSTHFSFPPSFVFHNTIYSKTASKLKIVAGQVSLAQTDPSEQVVSVTSIYIVNQYNSTYQQNDVALLKVNISLELFFKYSIMAACNSLRLAWVGRIYINS